MLNKVKEIVHTIRNITHWFVYDPSHKNLEKRVQALFETAGGNLYAVSEQDGHHQVDKIEAFDGVPTAIEKVNLTKVPVAVDLSEVTKHLNHVFELAGLSDRVANVTMYDCRQEVVND